MFLFTVTAIDNFIMHKLKRILFIVIHSSASLLSEVFRGLVVPNIFLVIQGVKVKARGL